MSSVFYKAIPESHSHNTGFSITAFNQNSISSKDCSSGFGIRLYVLQIQVFLETEFHFCSWHSTYWSKKYLNLDYVIDILRHNIYTYIQTESCYFVRYFVRYFARAFVQYFACYFLDNLFAILFSLIIAVILWILFQNIGPFLG